VGELKYIVEETNALLNEGFMRYVTSCVNANEHDIHDMIDNPRQKEIDYNKFRSLVKEEDLDRLEKSLGYDDDFKITDDNHVAYTISFYKGKLAAYLTHSHIEYIFQ
jgi:hypothetical protein